jgi:hypothetical protein
MVDTAQVTYEHTDGNTISFFTNDLQIEWTRPTLTIDMRPDGVLLVTDANVYQRVFSCSAVLSGDTLNTLNGYLIGSITYSGAYPRLTTIYLDSDTTLTNVEVAVTKCTARDIGNGYWNVSIVFTEKSA